MDVAVPGKGSMGVKQCSDCHTVETSEWRTGSDGAKVTSSFRVLSISFYALAF